MKLYMFRTVPLSIIRSYSLYTQHWYMSYRQLSSSSRIHPDPVCKPVWHIPLLSVQWIAPDDGQRNCPKHVEFHFQNKFEKLVHLVGFIIRTFWCMFDYPNNFINRTSPAQLVRTVDALRYICWLLCIVFPVPKIVTTVTNCVVLLLCAGIFICLMLVLKDWKR
jgi:hypothetical protein